MAKKREKVDFRTPLERKREETRESIIADFRAMWEETAGAVKPGRIINHLAREYDYSANGIVKMLKSAGIYRTNAGEPIIKI
jgi:hypothetical protein